MLRSVGLDLVAGEIHGLLGQNGSGKSTLIKILAGYYAPDPGGTLRVGEHLVPLPLDAQRSHSLGLSFVHQDLGLAPQMTVLENLRVGHFDTGLGWRIRWARERQLVRGALARFGITHIDPDAPIRTLRGAEQATVAIVRAFERLKRPRGGVLVLDEPTVYLPRDGVDHLFAAVRAAAGAGAAVLFVTHRLEEVRALADRVTVLRDGVRVGTVPTATTGDRELLELILGRALGALYPQQHDVRGDVVLSVRQLSGRDVDRFSLELRGGEIVGLTGLVGMGHERVPYLVFGAERPHAGGLRVGGREYELPAFSTQTAIRAGMALLPADRSRDGAAFGASVLENVTLPSLASYFRGGRLRLRREWVAASELLRMFQVTPGSPATLFGQLSGGNQQKALVGKWFETRPRILLLHEPTQGVDIGARQQLFQRIRDFAQGGGAVVIASVEYGHLAHLCDRVIVFRDGRAIRELRPPNLNEERLVEACFLQTEEVG